MDSVKRVAGGNRIFSLAAASGNPLIHVAVVGCGKNTSGAFFSILTICRLRQTLPITSPWSMFDRMYVHSFLGPRPALPLSCSFPRLAGFPVRYHHFVFFLVSL